MLSMISRWALSTLTVLAIAMVAVTPAGGSPRVLASDLPVPIAPAAPVDTAPVPISSGAPTRLIIPAAGVSGTVVSGAIDPATNAMVPPAKPFDVAYYGFSAAPGTGNMVFAGHVDYVGVGPAVFWNLDKLRSGDVVLVQLTDGSQLRYRVEFNELFDSTAGPWQELFSPQAAPDAVTLYTCAGNFNRGTHTYDQRRVVRADRAD